MPNSNYLVYLIFLSDHILFFYYINTPNIMPLDILLLGMFKFLF